VELPPRTHDRRLWISLAALLLGLPAGAAIWNAFATQRRIDETLHASRTQATLDQSLKGVTGLRVWGAGARTGGDSFCSCAIVPRPERIYFETSTPAEIRDFIALIRPRPYLTLEPRPGSCGPVTIDFLRGDQIIFWLHLHGLDLSSSRGIIPITSGSHDAIEEWLKQRSVRERIIAAGNRPPAK
jgi:hypothetical protein